MMMQDPMANITASPAGGQGAAGDINNTKEVFDPMVMQVNLQRIERIRAIMGIASGCVAGIFGFTGWEGLICFLTLHLFVCLTIWAWKMHFNLAAYTKQSWFAYLTTSIQPTALSFTLFWTLFYGLVYLY